ncbi:OmpA family protein [Anaerophaga thermohalophila]|uniref:OmpA family protein n=1 Tax=Anaerophaga thermohalophila TaxID=177400 RepID=UPI00145F75E0|nr:OmpA family protein [Anaerophaga thermohalophila]
MKLKKIFSLIMLFILSVSMVLGQSRTIRRGDKFFENEEYFKALQYYNEAKSQGEELSVDVQRRIAHCYYYLNEIDRAYNAFDDLKGKLKPEDLVNYALSAHKNGFYQEAIDLYRKTRQYNVGNQAQIKKLMESCIWALEHNEYNPNYYVNPSDFLTFGQSFGIQYYKDGVVYSSSSGDEGGSRDVDRYGKEFLNLYYSELGENGEILSKRLFDENMVFDYHVGAISFTSDQKTMYYTRSVRIPGGESRIKIYSVEFDGEHWVNEKVLPINSNDYDCAYPAVTPDDRYLVFASNMKGGYGGTDLYVAERYEDGRFGQPRNLGSQINTFGNERFPFVSKDYVLYYSSDGLEGFGGLDIFKAEKTGEASWGNPMNMKRPFNSNKDDFGYVIDPNDPTRGFLSSNRISSGEDVIFYVEPRNPEEEEESEEMLPMGGILYDEDVSVEEEMPMGGLEVQPEAEPEPEPEPDLSVFPDALSTRVTSTFNGTPVENAAVLVKDNSTNETVVEGSTDKNGRVHLVLPDEYRKEDQSFEIMVSKGDEYKEINMIVDIMELEDIARNGIALTPVFDDAVLDDIGTMIIPYRGESITAEGREVLNKLAAYLQNNPNVVVKLNAHTDARGNKYNNLLVSQKVAEKAENYLMERGIDDENVIPRGYGERYLVNKCHRGKVCEESEHLENRRIEVVVWKMLE